MTTGISVVLILAVAVIVLIAIRMPMGYALGIAGLGYFFLMPGDIGLSVLLDQMVRGIHSYSFLAVPFFLFAGSLMNTSGISQRIFDFALSLVGHIKGGLGHVNILASVIFAGMSGAALADAAGLGVIEIESMKREGYDHSFAACITAASSTIGPIIPPSITMVIYGVLAQASIGRLFIGGIVPGLIMAVALMITVYIMAVRKPESFPTRKRVGTKAVWKSFKAAFLPLWAPVIILGGIAFGVTTPTEAGVVAVVYAIILGIVYRQLDWKSMKTMLVGTAKQVGSVLFILAGARLFSYIMTLQRVPTVLTEAVIGLTSSPVIVLLILNVVLLVLGMFLNSSTILVLTVPILGPMLASYGVDPVHFGVVMTLNVMIGMLTPPLGVVLYVSANIAEVKFERVLKDIVPFYIPLVAVLLLITYIPDLVLWLPNLLMGAS
jgi:tripartite ATP-independent transporter DctM subunit